ncbi:MAG: hypothetical protein SCK70_15675, partial [bacterium]|nr:hypothetical protein [bacterium]
MPYEWYWIDDADSRLYERYQIVIADPLDPMVQGYVYFFRSSTIVPTAESYMEYTPGDDQYTGNDTVKGLSFIEAHHPDLGIPVDWIIPTEAGGNGMDILDRQKARGAGVAFGFWPLDLTEEWFMFVSIDTVVGKVRVARRLWLSLLGLISFDFPMYYYPYSIDSKGASGTIDPSQVQISHIRQSFDLNANADSMLFHNNFNTDIFIDGIPDVGVNTDFVYRPDVNWMMVSGDPGTVVTLLSLTELGNMRMYYYDNAAGGSGDGKADTGDMQSWGDVGILITETALEGRLSFSYLNYFLPANQQPETGAQFADNFKNPLNIYKSSQFVPVELVSFGAEFVGTGVKLNWTTATESNNYGFEVQRKISSAENWEALGFVKGHGTTATPQRYEFFDEDVVEGGCWYRLKQIDYDGTFDYSQPIEIFISKARTFALSQNYPNPFNPETVISYEIPEKMEGELVELVVFNVLGEEIRRLVSEPQSAGSYRTLWDGRDNFGALVSGGTYFCQLR